VRELNPASPGSPTGLISDLRAKAPERRPPSAATVTERLNGIFSPTSPATDQPQPQRPRKTGRRTKPGGKSKAKSGAKPRRLPFLRRHGVKLVVLLWLVGAGLGLAVWAGDRHKAGSKPPAVGPPPANTADG